MSVTVIDPARITSISATPNPAGVNEPVRFSSSATGTDPLTYAWNFGDGATGTGMSPTHAYARPGTYTVTLNVSNAAGRDSRTTTVTVNAPPPAPVDNCANITELNSAYFDLNASTLTDAARRVVRYSPE